VPGPPAISCRSPTPALALLLVGLDRLLLEHFLQIGIAIPGVVTLRAAGVVLIELGIRVIGSDPREIEANRVIFAIDLGKPVGGLDRVELAIDVDLFELVDQDDGRVSARWLLREGKHGRSAQQGGFGFGSGLERPGLGRRQGDGGALRPRGSKGPRR
jgi:hypothetical protein